MRPELDTSLSIAFKDQTHFDNSTAYKILACIPLIGTITQIVARCLSVDAKRSSDKQHKIEELTAKTALNVGIIVRDIVILAVAVALCALSIWGIIPMIVVGALSLTSLILNSYWLHKDGQSLRNFKIEPQSSIPKNEAIVNKRVTTPSSPIYPTTFRPQALLPSTAIVNPPGSIEPTKTSPPKASSPQFQTVTFINPIVSAANTPITTNTLTLNVPAQTRTPFHTPSKLRTTIEEDDGALFLLPQATAVHVTNVSHASSFRSFSFSDVETIPLDGTDPIAQYSLYELAEENRKKGLTYYVAATSDKNGRMSYVDAGTFLTNYFVHGSRENPLNRQEYDRVEFYSLQSLEDGTFKRFCSIEDLLSTENESQMRKIIIGANSLTIKSIESDQASLGLAYEQGDPFFKKDPIAALVWFQRASENGSFLAYMKLAEHEPTESSATRCAFLKKAYDLCLIKVAQSHAEFWKYKHLLDQLKVTDPEYNAMTSTVAHFHKELSFNRLHMGMITMQLPLLLWKSNKEEALKLVGESYLYLAKNEFEEQVKIFQGQKGKKNLQKIHEHRDKSIFKKIRTLYVDDKRLAPYLNDVKVFVSNCEVTLSGNVSADNYKKAFEQHLNDIGHDIDIKIVNEIKITS